MSRTEAEEALSEIERTTRRSQLLHAYRDGGPILMLWGVIWIVGYVAMGLLPADRWWMIWGPADLVGFVGASLLAARMHHGSSRAGGRWRMLAAAVAIGGFCGAVLTMFQATSPGPYLAFPGLVASVIYTLIGLWGMTRYVWIGVVLFAATLVGFFGFPAQLAFWMAAAGGGALILGGLWLRSA